jgi:hypothetical protein
MIRVVHPGSRIRIQGSKRHRIPDLDPGSGSATMIFISKIHSSVFRMAINAFRRITGECETGGRPGRRLGPADGRG